MKLLKFFGLIGFCSLLTFGCSDAVNPLDPTADTPKVNDVALQSAGDWSSSAQYASTSLNGFTLFNNVWGSGAGPQTIWASWGSGWQYWGVWANHPNTGGIKSYPNIEKYVGYSPSWVGSWFSCNRPSSGAYSTTYDIWCNGEAYEIMLWMNKTGSIGAIGSYQTTVTVGGHSWNVYKGYNGSILVFSFLRTSNVNTGNVDIKAIMNWIASKGWMSYSVTLTKIQCGFEITSSSGGMVFEMTGFSVWYG